MSIQQTSSDPPHPPACMDGIPQGESGRGIFDSMRSYKFDAEYETDVFINANNGIAITQECNQESELIVFTSKKRAIEVARAIIKLAKIATFEPEEDE